jgi:hypothetical protein
MPKFKLDIYGRGGRLLLTTIGEYESADDAVNKFASSKWQAYHDVNPESPSILINTENVEAVHITKY